MYVSSCVFLTASKNYPASLSNNNEIFSGYVLSSFIFNLLVVQLAFDSNLLIHLCNLDADTIVTSCSFTSINDLLDEADRNLLNLSATITSCPNICGLAWGTGSPDLSGIGVNISYKAQAALTVLCGPLLYLISTLRYQFRLDKRTLDYLSDIYESVVNISIGINLPVAIAALYCINQYPPFFDQTFSADLLDMQLSSFVVLVSTAPLLNELGVKHSNITVLCLAIQFSLWVIAETLVTVNIARWMSVEELVEDCKGYNQVTPFLIQTVKQVNLPNVISEE